ncbi:MAG: hypothetical protein HYW86_05270 [Candidatus Roizmanbacteria bacterium]|nr:MAG: hypothetical protein HYW86_05270 [Candidatus Roizmanbacteria bacterium]
MTEVSQKLEGHVKAGFAGTDVLDPLFSYAEADDPEALKILTQEFDEVCRDLNRLRSQPLDPNYYSNLIALNTLLGEKPVHPLRNVVRLPPTGSLEDIREKVVADWDFPTNQGIARRRRISGLLVEGYGVDLVHRYNNPELAQSFVLAFEEVMFTRHAGMHLLSDCIEWMIEDKDKFSKEIKADLDILEQLPLTVSDQLQQMPEEKRLNMVESLFEDLNTLFLESGLTIINGEFRVKDLNKIWDKAGGLNRRRRFSPLGDILGVRFVLSANEVPAATEVIKSNWRIPPVLRNGTLTERVFSGAQQWNSRSDPSYRAQNINIIFQDDQGKYQIAEVQLLSPGQVKIAKKTRPKYLKKRGRN